MSVPGHLELIALVRVRTMWDVDPFWLEQGWQPSPTANMVQQDAGMGSLPHRPQDCPQLE